MADFEDLQQKEIELDLENVPKDQRSALKEEVGQFVVDSILEKLASGQSPVSGVKFKALDKKYADKMKGGNRTPNLELEGDLLAALSFKNTRNGIAVGIMDGSQRPKADGHNNFSGDSKLPLRRFIPGEDQKFKTDIQSGIKDIIESYQVSESDLHDEAVQYQAEEAKSGIQVSLTDILSDQNIIDVLMERLSRGR